MRNNEMYLRWQRNVCIFLLITTIIVCLMGWHKYREERIRRYGLEMWIAHYFQSYDWGR